jgi:hypothetical protein
LNPEGTATVTQFQPRPQLLVRTNPTYRPTIYSYADAVFSSKLPPPTTESLRCFLLVLLYKYRLSIHIVIPFFSSLPSILIVVCLFRSAHLLASSFNFQGRVRKLFYVLTDDKIGSGPRLRPGVLAKKPADDNASSDQPMETDADVDAAALTKSISPPKTLAAKLAQAQKKRKATEQADQTDVGRSKAKR